MLTFLAVMGSAAKFGVQQLQPNTAVRLIENGFNIYHQYKLNRSIVCISSTLIGGAIGAALFVAQPNVATYIEPVITTALPFLGGIGTQIFSGFLGFWVAGGIGFNISKQVCRGVSKYKNGHSNTAYTMEDSQLDEIILSNPTYYALATNEIQDKQAEIEELKKFLLDARDTLTSHKSDASEHKRYKKALLEALRGSNLQFMIHLYSEKFETRTKVIEELSTKQKDMLNINQTEDHLNNLQVSIHIEDDHEDKSKANKPREEVSLKGNLRIYAHEKRFAKLMARAKTSSIKSYKPVQGASLLAQKAIMKTYYYNNAAIKYQSEKLEKEKSVIPEKLRPFILK